MTLLAPALLQSKDDVQRYETSDLRVRVYGDAAVVTDRLPKTRTVGEREDQQ